MRDVDDWRFEAACRDMRTELFFPVEAEVSKVAIAACERCPVSGQCLEDGRGLEGFRGGRLFGPVGHERRFKVEGDHGTMAGWRRHRADRTAVCGPCGEARGRWLGNQRWANRVEVQERPCACGCGRMVQSAGSRRIYASQECARAVAAKRSRIQTRRARAMARMG